MTELMEAWQLHKQCEFKDKDIKRWFTQQITSANVVNLLHKIDRLEAENAELKATVADSKGKTAC
jgi:uncharacterized protein (UPF0335 family)